MLKCPVVGTRKTILIVDDEASTVETYGRLLAFEGFTTISAQNVDAGLAEASLRHPDAIILDLRLGPEDGLSFLQRLRANDPERRTPVAIVTGDYFIDRTVSEQLRLLGAEICYKPLYSYDLIRLATRLAH